MVLKDGLLLGVDVAKTSPKGSEIRLDDNGWCKEDAKFDFTPGCTPVPCGECPRNPEKYPHAVPREVGIRTFGEPCTYDCALGHTLDRQAQGQKVFTIKCTATKEFMEPQVCKPVLCGPPRDHEHAMIIKPDAEQPRVWSETVTYNCKEGYSLTGMYGGEIEYVVTCKATAMFSKAPECLPVSCGPPPMVPHSMYPPATLYYSEAVAYVCLPGYTLSGIAGETNNKVLFCGAKGQYDSATPQCKPVECGKPAEYEHTTLKPAQAAKDMFY
jgi:CUB/sushi domain-containing protein